MKKLSKLTALTLALSMALCGCGGASSSAASTSKASTATPPTSGAPATSTAPAATDPNDKYPDKPIEIIVPYAPGASTDTTARIFSTVLSKYLPNGQSAVVVNKAGGGGSLGIADMVADGTGYKIGVTTTNSPLVLNPLTQDITYTYDDVTPLMQLVNIPSCLNVLASSEWKTAQEWITWVKAHPGEFAIGVTGIGGAQHIYLTNLAEKLGTSFSIVPFNSVALAQTAMLQGTVNGCICGPTNYDPDQTRILWTVSANGVELLPDVPTMEELNIDLAVEFSIALVVPTKMPANRQKIISDAFEQAIKDPDLIELFKKSQYQLEYISGPDLDKILLADIENSRKTLETLGLLKK